MDTVARKSRVAGRSVLELAPEPADPLFLVAPLVGRSAPDNKSGIAAPTRDFVATGAAWVDLLSRYEWAWFATFTFKEAIHPEAADKKFRYWVAQLGESYLGGNWRRKAARAPQWVRGLEWQKREVLHYHALITNLPRDYISFPWRMFFCAVWRNLDNGGLARIDQCDGQGAVYSYLSKYVAKGGEIDISATLPNFAPRLAFG